MADSWTVYKCVMQKSGAGEPGSEAWTTVLGLLREQLGLPSATYIQDAIGVYLDSGPAAVAAFFAAMHGGTEADWALAAGKLKLAVVGTACGPDVADKVLPSVVAPIEPGSMLTPAQIRTLYSQTRTQSLLSKVVQPETSYKVASPIVRSTAGTLAPPPGVAPPVVKKPAAGGALAVAAAAGLALLLLRR